MKKPRKYNRGRVLNCGEIYIANPCAGAMEEINKCFSHNKGVRHALTLPQQQAFMDYIHDHPVYGHWYNAFAVLIGTGLRCGEFIGLRWEDIDMNERTISVNHALVRVPREPLIIPHFSCHHLRHTFCTRYCENETNIKAIQSVMGHKNSKTTLDIYAEATSDVKIESMGNFSKVWDDKIKR